MTVQSSPNTGDLGPPRLLQLLTAGRTGSTYFNALALRAWSSLAVFQEREPSRSLAWRVSLADQAPSWLASALVTSARQSYACSRRAWLEKYATVLEINAFLSRVPMQDGPQPAATLHLVRSPDAWVESAIGFGAYAWRRPIAPLIPFWRERPDEARAQWSSLNEAERWAWRWVVRNRTLRLACATRSGPVMTLQAEALFGAERDRQLTASAELFSLDPEPLLAVAQDTGKTNPTPSGKSHTLSEDDRRRVWAIAREEAAHYGYAEPQL